MAHAPYNPNQWASFRDASEILTLKQSVHITELTIAHLMAATVATTVQVYFFRLLMLCRHIMVATQTHQTAA